MRGLCLGVLLMVSACGGKDDTACDDGSAVLVALSDSATGNPVMGTVTWTDGTGASDTIDCAGQCEFTPAPGTVTVSASPSDSTLGDEQTETVIFSHSNDCENPAYAHVAFEW